MIAADDDVEMAIEVRGIQADELRTAIGVCELAFSDEVHESDLEAWSQFFEWDRTFVATDGDTIVGTGGNYTFEMSVVGGAIPVAGLTMVGVLPTHRRRGVLRSLMESFLDDALRRGEPISALWASESSIYQRFGYGMASVHMQMEAERSRMAFLDDPGPEGNLRFLDADEASKVLPGIYDRAMEETPGFMSRSETWWKLHRLRDPEHARGGAGPMWRVVLELDDSPAAYALYRVKSDWREGIPRGKLQVLEAISTSVRSTRELWRFLFGVDLIETVEAPFMPVDHPLPMMLADPRRAKYRVIDNLWLRIADLPAALQGRDYSSDDTITFEVTDELLPDNAGVWTIDTSGDGVVVERSDDLPAVSMDIRDLGAAYLGAHTFTTLRRAGRVREATEGAVSALDAMFRSDRAPWCPEIF